jgi:hypothetical protein
LTGPVFREEIHRTTSRQEALMESEATTQPASDPHEWELIDEDLERTDTPRPCIPGMCFTCGRH